MVPQKLVVGERVLNNLNFLKRLCRSKSDSLRWKIIKKATTEELLTLVEICTNILRPERFCLSKKCIEKLQNFAPVVRALARKRSEKSARRFVVQQHGNGPLFIALLSPIIAEAARLIVDKV